MILEFVAAPLKLSVCVCESIKLFDVWLKT